MSCSRSEGELIGSIIQRRPVGAVQEVPIDIVGVSCGQVRHQNRTACIAGDCGLNEESIPTKHVGINPCSGKAVIHVVQVTDDAIGAAHFVRGQRQI